MWPFKNKSLSDLKQTKKVKILGYKFEIKRIDMLNYMDGSKVLTSSFQTYEDARSIKKLEIKAEKIKEHMVDVILAGVVKPLLTRSKGDGTATHIDDLFLEPELVGGLYNEIMNFTYSKKKVSKYLRSQNSSNLTS